MRLEGGISWTQPRGTGLVQRYLWNISPAGWGMPGCVLPHSFIFLGSGSPVPTASEKPDSPGSPSPPPLHPELELLAVWPLIYTRGGYLAWRWAQAQTWRGRGDSSFE